MKYVKMFNESKEEKMFTIEDMLDAFEKGAEASGSLEGIPSRLKNGEKSPYEIEFDKLKAEFKKKISKSK